VDEAPKSHDTPIVLELRPSDSSPGNLDINIYTPHGWTVGRQLIEAFEQDGVEVQLTGFAHDVTHTIVTLVSAAGGLAGAAAALNAFFQRHKHRKITVKTSSREVSIEGFSTEDTERLLKEALE
jgi:hypothetical protein